MTYLTESHSERRPLQSIAADLNHQQASEEQTEPQQQGLSYSVVIPVYGDLSYWLEMAQEAYESVEMQTLMPEGCYISMGSDLAEARNKPIFDKTVTSDRVIFLDADDTLEPNFIREVDKVDGDIVHTAVQYDNSEPRMLPVRDITMHNFLVCGSPVSVDLFRKAGGFDPDLDALEDWDLFTRLLLLHGATIGRAEKAVYRVNSRPNSRNKSQAAHDLMAELREKFSNWKLATNE